MAGASGSRRVVIVGGGLAGLFADRALRSAPPLRDDFRDAVAHFGKHPVTVSMTKQESGGFSHL